VIPAVSLAPLPPPLQVILNQGLGIEWNIFVILSPVLNAEPFLRLQQSKNIDAKKLLAVSCVQLTLTTLHLKRNQLFFSRPLLEWIRVAVRSKA
jgi:hypothetical protein